MNGLQLRNWLRVMRDPKSGKTKHKLENLENRNNRCCLGHLCYSMNGNSKVTSYGCDIEGKDTVFYDFNDEVWEHDVLPNELAKELDMTPTGSFTMAIDIGVISVRSMASLNDDTELTPAEIADVIEAQFRAGNVTPYDGSRF